MENPPCVFCDRGNLADRLIYENDYFYVVATLGQITDGGYLLMIPKMHVPCMAALTDRQTQNEWLKLMFLCLTLSNDRKNDKENLYPATVFEHGIVGQTVKHAHLHILPVALDMTARIMKDFHLAEIQKLNSFEQLSDLYARRSEPYLLWTTPDGRIMTCWNPPAPNQYLRTVAAEFLGRPERADWQTMDQELDARLWRETVTRMRLYFFQALK